MMANQSMIRIEEKEDQLRRILMFFNIDFSDRLNSQWNCNKNRRNPGGGVERVSESTTSLGEPNKFYSNCNYNNEINRNHHSHYHHRCPSEHTSRREAADYFNRRRHFDFCPHRVRHVSSELSAQPGDISDFEYIMKKHGTERSYREQRYQPEPKADIRKPDLALRPAYPNVIDIKRAYSKADPYSRSKGHYDYSSPRLLKRPPPVPEPAALPIDYYSYCPSPQREYTSRQYAEPTPSYPRSPRIRQRQASGSVACEYPPLYRHGSYTSDIGEDYASYTPEYNYENCSKRKADHGNYNRYNDYYDQRTKDYDYYDTPRHQVLSVSPRDQYFYEGKASPPPSCEFFSPPKTSHKSVYEYREKRPKPAKSTPPKEFRCNYHTPMYSKDREVNQFKARTKNSPPRRKSLEFRGAAGLDGDTEIPHRILKQTKISSAVSINKRNHSSTDRTDRHASVSFSGVDIPYKRKEEKNSILTKYDSHSEKRHDSGCDYYRPSNSFRNLNVNRVSVACQRSCHCQVSPTSLRANRRSLYEVRPTRRRSLKQRISGFLRKSKVCLNRTRRRTFRSKRLFNNAQTQCCACGNDSSVRLSRSKEVKRSTSCLTVRNKWYSKRKNGFPLTTCSRDETPFRSNVFRQHVYPTVYREKSIHCGMADEEDYHQYSMLNCERACPLGRSRCATNRCYSNEDNEDDDCPSPCLSACSKVNNLRNHERHGTCASCVSQSSIGNNPKPSKTVTIRGEDVNLLAKSLDGECPPAPCDMSSKTDCRIIKYQTHKRISAGSPSLDTLKCPENNYANVRSALKLSPSPSQSRCSLSLSRNGSRASIVPRPRLIPAQYSFSSMSNSSQSKLICFQPPPCTATTCKPSRPSLIRRDPNDMTPRPSKRVSLNTNCSIFTDDNTCGKRSSQPSPKSSSESVQGICRNSLHKKICSETSIKPNCPSQIRVQASVSMPQVTAFNGNITNCAPRKCGSETSINSRKNACKSSCNNLQKNSVTRCRSASKTSVNSSCPPCSKREDQKLSVACCSTECPNRVTETDENVCSRRSVIEELKEELLQKLQGKAGPGLKPTPQVMFLPCVPDAFCHMNGVVDNPFGKSYTKSIMCWGQYSQMPGPM